MVREIAKRLIALLITGLTLPAFALGAAESGCNTPMPTDEESIFWAGSAWGNLSKKERDHVLISMKFGRQSAESKKLAATHNFTGRSGREAVETLQADGFICSILVVGNARPGDPKLSLPIYSCSKVDASSCVCKRFDVTFGLRRQLTESSSPSYKSVVDAAMLEDGELSYSCHDD